MKIQFILFVEPPTEPREPGITDFDSKSVTLRWNKPVDDGGRPVTHFVIQKKDQFGGDHHVSISQPKCWKLFLKKTGVSGVKAMDFKGQIYTSLYF